MVTFLDLSEGGGGESELDESSLGAGALGHLAVFRVFSTAAHNQLSYSGHVLPQAGTVHAYDRFAPAQNLVQQSVCAQHSMLPHIA